MAMKELTLDSLADLDDGRVMVAFSHEVRRAVMDCMDRPGDKKARTVTLEFHLTPITETNGGMISCAGADGEFHIKSKVPTRKSKTYNFRTNTKGHLIYSSNSPEDADQTTFDDVDPNTGRVKR